MCCNGGKGRGGGTECTCTSCPSGKYCNMTGATVCVDCDVGKYAGVGASEYISCNAWKHVTMTIRLPAMTAAPCAQSSVDTRALMQNPTSATQPVETSSSLALSNTTTGTPTVGMDTVQTEILLRLDGCVLPCRVVSPPRTRCAARASTEWKQPDPVKHRARLAARASTGSSQDQPLKHRARLATRASTGTL